jgi:hypothetical protein
MNVSSWPINILILISKYFKFTFQGLWNVFQKDGDAISLSECMIRRKLTIEVVANI